MEAIGRRRTSMPMLFALFCFFLPFLTVSCPGGSVTVTGIEIATGAEAKKQVLGKISQLEIPGERYLPWALGLTALAALIGLAAGRVPQIAAGAIGALNFILLLAFKSKLDHLAATEGGGLVQMTWVIGFWLALIAYAATAGIAFVILQQRNPAAAPPPPPPPPPPSATGPAETAP